LLAGKVKEAVMSLAEMPTRHAAVADVFATENTEITEGWTTILTEKSIL